MLSLQLGDTNRYQGAFKHEKVFCDVNQKVCNPLNKQYNNRVVFEYYFFQPYIHLLWRCLSDISKDSLKLEYMCELSFLFLQHISRTPHNEALLASRLCRWVCVFANSYSDECIFVHSERRGRAASNSECVPLMRDCSDLICITF